MSREATLWAALPMPVILLDHEGRIQRLNPAAEAYLNGSERSFQGARLTDKMALSVDLTDLLARIEATQSPLYVDGSVLSLPDQPAREVNLHLAPSGSHLLLVLHPKQAGEYLGQVKAPKAARQAIGMAEMLAHEVKNPLAGITGAAQLLAMSLSDADRELTDLIVAESRRIVALLDQVEQFGDLRPPARKPVNIHDILDRARATAQLGFAGGMQFSESYDPSLPEVWADADQLQQVFLNLFMNAAQACDNKGNIIIRTFYEAGLHLRLPDGTQASLPLQVEVTDDGPGLPPDLADHVFDPFVSGRENGTGLGLALVSKILTDHNALIAVDSRPGRTVFRVSLPVVPKPAKQGA